MKRLYIYLFLAGMSLYSCDFINPTEADPNPNLTEDAIVGTGSATRPWLIGLQRQLAIVANNYIVINEIASDNYVNTSTFFNTNFDDLFIQYGDADINNFLFAVSDLRESAKYGLAVIAPSDESTTDDDLAEMHYAKGISFMLAGEMFAFFPTEPEGNPVPSATVLDSAVISLQRAISLGSGASASTLAKYHTALARVYYDLGDKTNAVAEANTVLTLDDGHISFIEFDNTNTPRSTPADAIYDRTNFDLQPLPRLDFLDPKFHTIGTNETPIPFTKAEEAYLILTEAALSDSDLDGAKDFMTDLLSLVGTRAFEDIPENDKRLENGGTGFKRPNGSDIMVRASSVDPFKSNLILDRVDSAAARGTTVTISVPIESGTSVLQSDVDALSTIDEALELCYLLRQEVFIGEGRRMQDLGVKLPVSQTEALQNVNVDGVEIEPVIPDFLPADSQMDAFTWDRTAKEVTILHNMNKILVENKTSPLVVPFF